MSPASDGVAQLKRLLRSGQHNDVNQMIRDKDTVISQFGPAFLDAANLDEATFSEFLRFEHNRHWWTLHRNEDKLIRHFDLVRDLISDLVDDETPIGVRIDGIGALPGFTSDVYTAILLVAFPDEYGVRSQISDAAMQRLGLFPDLDGDLSAGEAYEAVNEVLSLTASELGTDLWTLDALWWGIEKEHDATKHFQVKAKRAASTSSTRRMPSPKALPSAKPVTETFMCRDCFATKIMRLSSDTPGVCIDCAR